MTQDVKSLVLRKGVEVYVISGDHKGQKGEVLSVDKQRSKVVVKGLNMVKRKGKRSGDGSYQSVVAEAPIHRSNVRFA